MWQREIRHDGLHKYRIVKGQTEAIVYLRAEMQMLSWNEQWARFQAAETKRTTQLRAACDKEAKKNLAADRTREAQKALDVLEHLLTSVLEEDHTIDWSVLLDQSDYPTPKPTKQQEDPLPREPKIDDMEFELKLSFLERITPSLREKERQRVNAQFRDGIQRWSEITKARRLRTEEASECFEKELFAWQFAKAAVA